MKKVLFTFVILMLGIVVQASTYSLGDVSKVINDGDVTKQFLKGYTDAKCDASLSSTVVGQSVNINYHFKCETEKEDIRDGKKQMIKTVTDNTGTISLVLNGDVLVSEVNRTEKEIKDDEDYAKVLKLVPYWGTEMSSKYSEIKKYIKKNHDNKPIDAFETVFDKCYMEKMGVCYSAIPGMNYTTYIGRIKLDDTAATYALKHFKKEQREIDNKNLSFKAIIVAGILLVIIVICKSLVPDPTRKRCKY